MRVKQGPLAATSSPVPFLRPLAKPCRAAFVPARERLRWPHPLNAVGSFLGAEREHTDIPVNKATNSARIGGVRARYKCAFGSVRGLARWLLGRFALRSNQEFACV